MQPEFCSIIFRVHPWFYSLTIQGDLSIDSTIYVHVIGHKEVGGGAGDARAPSAPWLDPPLWYRD